MGGAVGRPENVLRWRRLFCGTLFGMLTPPTDLVDWGHGCFLRAVSCTVERTLTFPPGAQWFRTGLSNRTFRCDGDVLSALTNMVPSDYMWPLSISNTASVTEELNF